MMKPSEDNMTNTQSAIMTNSYHRQRCRSRRFSKTSTIEQQDNSSSLSSISVSSSGMILNQNPNQGQGQNFNQLRNTMSQSSSNSQHHHNYNYNTNTNTNTNEQSSTSSSSTLTSTGCDLSSTTNHHHHHHNPQLNDNNNNNNKNNEQENKTSDIQTMMHVLKTNIGTGVLAMPRAFKNAGLWLGFILLPIIATVCIHCMHILISSHNRLCDKFNYESLDYDQVAALAFACGPRKLRKLAKFAQITVTCFLMFTQFGFCCVYVMFVVTNLQVAMLNLFSINLSITTYMFILFPIIGLTSCISNLKHLAIISTIANMLQLAGLSLIFADLFQSPTESSLPDSLSSTLSYNHEVLPISNDLSAGLPLYFATVVYAFEGIGVVLPLVKEMEKPELFPGFTGVLNTSMMLVGLLYMAMGYFGYLKYGQTVSGSITIDLPKTTLNEFVRLMFALAIGLSYSLQFYVPWTIVWPWIDEKLFYSYRPRAPRDILDLKSKISQLNQYDDSQSQSINQYCDDTKSQKSHSIDGANRERNFTHRHHNHYIHNYQRNQQNNRQNNNMMTTHGKIHHHLNVDNDNDNYSNSNFNCNDYDDGIRSTASTLATSYMMTTSCYNNNNNQQQQQPFKPFISSNYNDNNNIAVGVLETPTPTTGLQQQLSTLPELSTLSLSSPIDKNLNKMIGQDENVVSCGEINNELSNSIKSGGIIKNYSTLMMRNRLDDLMDESQNGDDLPNVQWRPPPSSMRGKRKLVRYTVILISVSLTFVAAAAIPRLDLFISLIGALSSSSLAIIFPPLIEICTFWANEDCDSRLYRFVFMLKNVLIIIFGIAGLITGTWVSLNELYSAY